MEAPAGGWYPDPHDPTKIRWWDGAAWTEHVQANPAAVPAAAAAQPMQAAQPTQPAQQGFPEQQFQQPQPAAGFGFDATQQQPGLQQVPPMAVGTNTLAIVSLILSIALGAVGGIIAQFLGRKALGQIEQTGEGGRGMAKWSIWIGYVQFVLTVVIVILFFTVLHTAKNSLDKTQQQLQQTQLGTTSTTGGSPTDPAGGAAPDGSVTNTATPTDTPPDASGAPSP